MSTTQCNWILELKVCMNHEPHVRGLLNLCLAFLSSSYLHCLHIIIIIISGFYAKWSQWLVDINYAKTSSISPAALPIHSHFHSLTHSLSTHFLLPPLALFPSSSDQHSPSLPFITMLLFFFRVRLFLI